MIFGLPILTLFLAIGIPIVAILLSVLYVITFNDGDDWLTIEDIVDKFRKGK